MAYVECYIGEAFYSKDMAPDRHSIASDKIYANKSWIFEKHEGGLGLSRGPS